MAQDRDYYRSLDAEILLLLAREEGINPEMAIALAEELQTAYSAGYDPYLYEGCATGHFTFNHSQ